MNALKGAERRSGSAWLVTGPAGIGKSRLLREIQRLAERRGFVVRHGYGLEGSVIPLLHFRQVVRPAAAGTGGLGAERGAAISGSGRGDSLSIDHEILDILGELERAAVEQPQLVLLDDLEAADPESLRCLRLLSRAVRSARIVVVAAARVDLESWEQSRFGRSLLALRQDGFVRWVELPPLRGDDRFRLAAHLLGQPLSTVRAIPAVGELVSNSGGTPYFLIELVSAWVDSERGSTDRGAPSLLPGRLAPPGTHGLPSAVATVVRDRLRRLPAADLRVLGVAGQLGTQFGADGIAAALGEPVRAVGGRLERLAAVGWPIVPVARRRHAYAFAFQAVRTMLRDLAEYAPPLSSRRRLVDWWSVHRPDDPLTEGRLRRSVGDVDGALACLRRSVDLLLPQGAYASLEEVLVGDESLVDSEGPVPPALVSLTLASIARLRERLEFYWAGRLLEGLPVDRFPEPARWTARCWRVESLAFRDVERASRELADLERISDEATRHGATDAATVVTYLRALCHLHREPGAAGAHALLAEAAAALDDGAHEFERCRILFLDSTVEASEGHDPEARRLVGEARGILAHLSPELRELRFLVHSAESDLAYRDGNVAEALRIQRALGEEYAHRGLVGLRGRTLLNLGNYEYGARQTREADADLRAAVEIFTTLGNPGLAAVGQTLRGWNAVVERRWEEAEQIFRGTLRLEIGTDVEGSHWASAAGLALVTAEQGDPPRALRRLPAPVELLGGGRSGGYLVEYFVARARILELMGDPTGAKAALETAEKQVKSSALEQAEVYAQLARWEERHGTPVGRARWTRKFGASPGAKARRSLRSWRGLAFDPPGGPRTTSVRRSLPRTSRAEVGAAPIGDRLLEALRTSAGGADRGPVVGSGAGFTEAQLANAIGLPRDRLSRALRRLCADGRVERIASRPAGAPRRLFLYRLTSPGEPLAGRQGGESRGR